MVVYIEAGLVFLKSETHNSTLIVIVKQAEQLSVFTGV